MAPLLERRAYLLPFALFLAACSANPPPAGSGLPNQLAAQPQQAAPGQLTGILPSTDLAVGPSQRFLFVAIDSENRVVSDADVDLALFKVTGQGAAQLRSQTRAVFEESLVGKGAYVARADFDEPGEWGVVASVKRPSEEPKELRLSFQVKPKSLTPGIGQPVPASRTLTGSTQQDVEKFSSARPADPSLYRLSIDQALQEHKPLAVLFATPGFCVSRLCGPSLEVLQKLQTQYGDGANYIHVEIYKDGRPNDKQEVVPTVQEWGLTSEPWLFLVGADGRMADKFEGVIAFDEVNAVLGRLIGGESS